MAYDSSGGWATGAILATCGQFQLFRLMPPPKDITINWRPRWRRQKWPGDGVAALLLGGGNRCILGVLVLGACWGTEELGWTEQSRKKLRDVR